PFWRPNPLTSVTVMPCTPRSANASRTSSSLKGLMMAQTIFIAMLRGPGRPPRSLALRRERCRETEKKAGSGDSAPGRGWRSLRPARELRSVAGLGELRVGLEAAFVQIHALVFLLLGDPDADRLPEREPHEQAGEEHPREDHREPDELAGHAGLLV